MLNAILRQFRREPEPMTAHQAWKAKQALAAPGRYYGDGGTIHDSGVIDVVVQDGKVTEVWFRCQPLSFRILNLDKQRGEDGANYASTDAWLPAVTGVEVLDPTTPGVDG